MRRFGLWVIAFAASVTVGCRGGQDAAPAKLHRVDLLVSNWHEAEIVGYIAARNQHYDRANGLDLHIIPVGPETDPALWVKHVTEVVAPDDKTAQVFFGPKGQALLGAAVSDESTDNAEADRFAIVCSPQFILDKEDYNVRLWGVIRRFSTFEYVCGPELVDDLPSVDKSPSFANLRLAVKKLKRPLRIGVRPDRESTILFTYLIQQAGLTSDQVEEVVAGDAEQFLNRRIDLWPTDTIDDGRMFLAPRGPIRAKRLPLLVPVSESSAKPRQKDRTNLRMYGQVLIANVGVNHDVADQLRRALWSGWQWAAVHFDEAVRLLPDYANLTPAERTRRLRTLSEFRLELVKNFDPRPLDQTIDHTFDKYVERDPRWRSMSSELASLVVAPNLVLKADLPGSATPGKLPTKKPRNPRATESARDQGEEQVEEAEAKARLSVHSR